MADKNLRLVLVVDDQATPALQSVQDGVAKLGTDSGAWADDTANAINNKLMPAAAELNIPFRSLSVVLSGLGLQGPATMLRMASGMNQIVAGAGAAAGALSAILPVALAMAAAVLLIKGAWDLAITSQSIAGEQLRNFAGEDGPLGALKKGFGGIKEAIAGVLAKELVRELVIAQTAIVGFLNAIMPVIISAINTMIGSVNGMLGILPSGILSALGIGTIKPLEAWKPVPLDLSWQTVGGHGGVPQGNELPSGHGGGGGAGGKGMEALIAEVRDAKNDITGAINGQRGELRTAFLQLPKRFADALAKVLF